MNKSMLQELCQQQRWELPQYATAKVGPDHMPLFTATVDVAGQLFETPSQCKTSNEAQNSAARVALDNLTPPGLEASQDCCKYLFKNLLQKLAQEKGLACPSYKTIGSGLAHVPIFVSTVEIGTDNFEGFGAKTKKQAEASAAQVAYMALTKRD